MPFIPVDLHSHSVNSDGSLGVKELITLAKQNGSEYLALTDHDTVAGISEARKFAAQCGLNLIPGVEISVTWTNNSLIHILGLGINETNLILQYQLDQLRSLRLIRGQRISDSLAKYGIHNAIEGALKYCTTPESLSRTHFAQFLVASGYAKPNKVFEKFLTTGKPGYTEQTWIDLESAVTWIKESGGIAVIAHPARYKFTRTKLVSLINEFKEYGGIGIEVMSSSHNLEDITNIASICRQTGLLASSGSDFHKQENFRNLKVGITPSLPYNLATVFPLLNIDYKGQALAIN